MNQEMSLSLDELKPETREQLAITNRSWMRLTKLQKEYSELSKKLDLCGSEIKVAGEDHKIQETKLAKFLNEETFEYVKK